MPPPTLTPAAEYVRMSTDDQHNSIPIQQLGIQQYAEAHGFEVVVTYMDPGKSGIGIKHRPGLRQLIQDVVVGQTRFKAILVYDVSRWGRFQDTDEAAHYEFLCRSAGIPIHYCAETFPNDATMSSAIMKSLKRAMAAEYSRELAIKVSTGMRQIVAEGFRGGGVAGYGLRRMLISSDGHRQQILQSNEHKNVKSDRIILVPGPRHEVDCIRTIFALAAKKQKSPVEIAKELNRRGATRVGNQPWNRGCVYLVLKNEKYMGSNVWGKVERPLGRFSRRTSPCSWTTKAGAFIPLVRPEQFARVQELIQERKTKRPKRPDSYFLNRLRKVLVKEGKLSQKLLSSRGSFSSRTYCNRFGSLLRAYELIGYKPAVHAFRSVNGWKKMQRLREELFIRMKQLFPSQLKIIQLPRQTQRRAAELDNDLQITIHICRPLAPASGKQRWLLTGQPKEVGIPALICMPDENMNELMSFYVVPEFTTLIKRQKVLREGHPLLAAGKRFESLSQFYEVAKEVAESWRPQNDITLAGDVVVTGRSSTITIAGHDILLSHTEAAVFKLLLDDAGRVVPSEKLCSCRDRYTEWFLRTHICGLRKKLGVFRKRIVTVAGKRYMYQTTSRGDPANQPAFS